MGKRIEKEKERLLSKPKDYSYKELSSLLGKIGYEEKKQGKTSGSRVRFYNPQNGKKISIHKPHPGSIVKAYVINQVIDHLKENGEI